MAEQVDTEMRVHAILVDTRSIQKFIFGGNRLKTNIGASYLVTEVFNKHLFPVIEKDLKIPIDTETWEDRIPVELLERERQAVVAANAGGNALVLFSKGVGDEERKEVVRLFSQALLTEVPGLHIGAAHGEVRVGDVTMFEDLKNTLFKSLKENQNTIFPQVSLPYTGLTQRCPVNGETANCWYFDREAPHFYSQETVCKLEASGKATKRLKDLLHDKLQAQDPSGAAAKSLEDFEFPTEFAEIGRVKNEKNFFAIVHIDGNNMGVKFQNCESMSERSRLSKAVGEKTWHSFARLMTTIVEEHAAYVEKHGTGRREGEKPYLPIRPIIIGGDDVTFVCSAHRALDYVKRFMGYMMDPAVGDVQEEEAKQIDCCAGIAFLKVTYPFSRGYELAEELCGAAKAEMRAQQAGTGKGSCWLDFALLHGEQAPTLSQIRAQEYTGADSKSGGLHFGPYQLFTENAAENPRDLENLLEAVRSLQGIATSAEGTAEDGEKPAEQTSMGRGKAKELREALRHGKPAVQQFCTQLQHLGKCLPKVPGWEAYEANGLFLDKVTPYIDAIEMMEFLPEEEKEHEA